MHADVRIKSAPVINFFASRRIGQLTCCDEHVIIRRYVINIFPKNLSGGTDQPRASTGRPADTSHDGSYLPRNPSKLCDHHFRATTVSVNSPWGVVDDERRRGLKALVSLSEPTTRSRVRRLSRKRASLLERRRSSVRRRVQ